MHCLEFHVRKGHITVSALREAQRPFLQPGQVRLRIDLFSLTANNISYAALGASLGPALDYWAYFPVAPEHAGEWGLVPVWGFATVTESCHPEVAPGERFYGFYPMASEVVLAPVRLSESGFFDGAPHRTVLHPAYNRYFPCRTDPLYTAGTEAVQALLRPLFITSWLVADLLEEQAFFGASRVLISSASSKTAYGAALQLAGRAGLEVVALTSPGNLAFCEQLGCYSRVLPYGQLDALDTGTPCAYVDFSGNAALRAALHQRFPHLRASLAIGYTHVAELGAAQALPGPAVAPFFAPDRIRQRSALWGAAEFSRRLALTYHRFAAVTTGAPAAGGGPALRVQCTSGANAASAAYRELLAGGGDPHIGRVLTLAETGSDANHALHPATESATP